jgi:hypothetical protein
MRDTTTGSDYEDIVELCIKRSCERNGLKANSQVIVGDKPGGGKHRVDWEIHMIEDPNIRGLISCKFQSTSGTAEEKIAYEVIKLLHTMKEDSRFIKGWIIMGGNGWSEGIREFVKSELSEWIPGMKSKIDIISTDQLINANLNLESPSR